MPKKPAPARRASREVKPGVSWINVFQLPNGKQHIGMRWSNRLSAVNSRYRGLSAAYRIKVTLKPQA